ncbi:MAG: hypothetical protein PVG18_05245, partial [Thioalkalispiraceae bacterium]
MPYFVFKINPSVGNLVKNLELLESFEEYKAAKNFTKQQRIEQSPDDSATFKVMFAETQLEAEEK